MQALAVAPLDHELLHTLALALNAQGQSGAALVLLQQALTEQTLQGHPQNPQLHFDLGLIYQLRGEHEQALLAYQSCLRHAPDHQDALWNCAELLRQNEQFEQAYRYLKRLQRPGCHYPDFAHSQALVLAGLGELDAALNAFEQALSLSASNPALTAWEYAQILLLTGDFRRRLAALRTALPSSNGLGGTSA